MPCRSMPINNAMIFSSSFLFLLIVFLLFSILVFFSLSVHAIDTVCLFILLILWIVFLSFLLLLLLSVLNFILDQVMEGGDSSDQTAKVDSHQLIVCLDTHSMC